MPAWWGKKSTKPKEDTNNSQNERPFNSPKKPRDGELLSRASPRLSRDFGAGGVGGSSTTTTTMCHPLPMPSPSTPSSANNEHGVGFGSGSASGSVSSVGSSGSSEDQPIVHDNGQFGGGCVLRAHNNSSNATARARSPGPCCRGPTSPTSPLHPMLSGMSTDSPGSQGHRLPLPPGSPTSPPTMPPHGAAAPHSKWKKGKLLGRGSFGHVYIGFNSEGGQMCAIKEVRLISDDHTSRESLKQLHQEIHLLSQLSHPNIVRYHGSELVEETLSVYLEYVSGGSIHKLLQDYGSFKEPVIQNYTRQILSGLAYLHGRNTVHRDIKGANILVDPNGEIKLADFGMAKLITNCSSMLSFKGSPYWMAPEVVMNTNGYSLAVDIWSLGCTVLEMATSKPPWSQYEGVAAIFKIGNSKDMPEIPDHLSNDAKSFIRLCLQRDPSARPTALKLLEHPFIREQTTTRNVNTTLTRDAFPFAFDGSRTPPILESVVTPPSRSIRNNPRDNNSPRAITSLPVSPCSSPLRQYGGAATNRNFFRSPPHPSFAVVGQTQNGYNLGANDYSQNGYSSYPLRTSNTSYTLDPFRDGPLLKAHTPPGGSPITRHPFELV